MTDSDLKADLAPWLDRWSLGDLDPASPWLADMRRQHFDAGAFLVRPGERSDTLYLLLEGLVRLVYASPDGRVAQFHLASYLGIDAVSLSRLKRKHSH